MSVSDDPLPLNVQTAAYFVLCELMTNAIKYASGAAITVTALVDGPELILEVIGDGPGGADPSGSGLWGIAERVRGCSGALTIRSEPGCGTRALARLPLRRMPGARLHDAEPGTGH